MKILGTLALSAAVLAGTATGTWWTGADPHAAIAGLPGASNWPAAVAATMPSTMPATMPATVPSTIATRRAGGFVPAAFTTGPAAPDPDTASPAQVASFFASLTPAQRTALAHAAPGVVGNLDGAPYDLRYAANTQALGSAQPRPSGQLLGYDPRGDGRAIEVFGDLATARHIAIVVPGTGWDLHRLLTEEHTRGDTPVATAEALYAELRRLDPTTPTAVVVWLGYDPPENIDREVMRSGRAIEGAHALTRFVQGLPATAHVSAVCHSYGAVVCAYAIRDGARIADLAAVAAPGMDVGSARDLEPARVWATRVADDPIRFTPFVRVAGLGHGADPMKPAFGARIFRTGTAHGHGGYFVPGTESLSNLARIALGRVNEVTLR